MGAEMRIENGKLVSLICNVDGYYFSASLYDWGTTTVKKDIIPDNPGENPGDEPNDDPIDEPTEKPNDKPGDEQTKEFTKEDWENLFVFDNVTYELEVSSDGETFYITVKFNGEEIEFKNTVGNMTATIYSDGTKVYLNGTETNYMSPSQLYETVLMYVNFADYYDSFEQISDSEFYSEEENMTVILVDGKLSYMYASMDDEIYCANFYDWGCKTIELEEDACDHYDYDYDGYCDWCDDYIGENDDENHMSISYEEWKNLFKFENVTISMITEVDDGEYKGTVTIIAKVNGDEAMLYGTESMEGTSSTLYTDGYNVYEDGELTYEYDPYDVYDYYLMYSVFADYYKYFEEVSSGVYYSEYMGVTITVVDGALYSIVIGDSYATMTITFSNWGTTVAK